jgi:hypothetical protein
LKTAFENSRLEAGLRTGQLHTILCSAAAARYGFFSRQSLGRSLPHCSSCPALPLLCYPDFSVICSWQPRRFLAVPAKRFAGTTARRAGYSQSAITYASPAQLSPYVTTFPPASSLGSPTWLRSSAASKSRANAAACKNSSAVQLAHSTLVSLGSYLEIQVTRRCPLLPACTNCQRYRRVLFTKSYWLGALFVYRYWLSLPTVYGCCLPCKDRPSSVVFFALSSLSVPPLCAGSWACCFSDTIPRLPTHPLNSPQPLRLPYSIRLAVDCSILQCSDYLRPLHFKSGSRNLTTQFFSIRLKPNSPILFKLAAT